MQSGCMREASDACFKTCCLNPVLTQPQTSSTIISDAHHDFVAAILSSIQPSTAFTNHESLPSSSDLLCTLKTAFPQYSNTVLADDIRAREYYHLSVSSLVCLDYVGHGLFSYAQQQTGWNGNPSTEIASSSSSSSTSSLSDSPFFDILYKSVNLNAYLLHGSQESRFEAAMRKRITRYMNLYEEDYSLVFTANQSSAFKILADSYPFQSNQTLLTVYDHDNEAVQTMVESAKKRGARVQSAVFSWPNLRVNSKDLRKLVVNKRKLKNRGLFAFPLQSRITGSRYSYQWMNLARENGWHVLLDASALGAKDMETLGLSIFQPDFLICSFYKIFGQNPSGFCCLFIKKSSATYLTHSSTSNMGIVSIIPSKGPFQKLAIEYDETQHQKQQPLASTSQQMTTQSSEMVESDEKAELECRGLDHADTLGLILISSRVRVLVNWLTNALLSLQHPHSGNNIGLPLVMIYGPRIKLDRGPALAFNVYDWKGERVDPSLVQKLADRHNISLTCGFLENIWFSKNFRQDKDKVLETIKDDNSKQGGVRVVSVTVGMLSSFEDMYRMWGFVSRFLDADFVEKERWRYTALNQTTVEV